MELLNREQEKVRQRDVEKKEEEALRHMVGQNQYNRHAVEVFFLLSRNMDYKA